MCLWWRYFYCHNESYFEISVPVAVLTVIYNNIKYQGHILNWFFWCLPLTVIRTGTLLSTNDGSEYRHVALDVGNTNAHIDFIKIWKLGRTWRTDKIWIFYFFLHEKFNSMNKRIKTITIRIKNLFIIVTKQVLHTESQNQFKLNTWQHF